MAIMPGAQWRPLPRPSSSRMARYDLVVLHTCVGSFEGTDAYFRRLTNGVNSHFLTGGYGEIRQLVDTAVRSGANGAGNHRSITVENADMGPGFAAWNTNNGADVPAFTPQQIEANARICAWAHLEHGVPLVAADTSRPNARGIGYHRLGCNPWRVPDGELWSSATGKVCPGNRRIAQIPQIIARAREIAVGTTIEEDFMSALSDDEQRALFNWVKGTATAVDWWFVTEPGPATKGELTQHIRGIRNDAMAARAAVNAQSSAFDALTKLVAEQNGLTVDDVRAAVREEIAKGVDVDVTVTGASSSS